MYNEDVNNTSLLGLGELVHVKCLEQQLVYDKPYLSVDYY